MHRHTRYLLALCIAAGSTMIINPCRAQTAANNADNSDDKALLNPQPASKTDINNPTDKSVIPSDAVSQTSTENAATPNINPRIPIPSRIFFTMQQ